MTCSGPDCQKPAKRRGLCWGHERMLRRHPDRPLRELKPPKGGVLSPQEQFDLAVAAFARLKPSQREEWARARQRVREASVRLFLSQMSADRERAWQRLQEAIFASYEVSSENDDEAKRARARLLRRAMEYGATRRRNHATARAPRPQPIGR